MRERTQALNTLCQSADDKKGRNWLRPEFQLKSYFKHYRYVKPQELERSCFLRLCGAAEGPPPGCAARDFFSSAKVSSGALADLPSVASAPAAAAPAFLAAGSTRDRKSTRLNSSHSQISYAVFCLKKKKKNKIQV